MNPVAQTAFILQVHNHPDQVNKFIHQLIADNQADVYVHIDRKSYGQMKEKIIKSPNVIIIEESVNIEWGDISQVDATLLLLKKVLEANKDYDFVCLRSGQDLLVKNGFKTYLSENKTSIFMTSRKLSEGDLGLVKIKWPKIMRKRYANFHPIRMVRRLLMSFFSKGINLLPNRYDFPKNYSFYKGSQWFSLPLEVVEYIMQFLDENKWYYNFYENTLVPDESFFHTLIMNSPYKTDVVNQNLFYLKWGETLSERNSPQLLKKENIDSIRNSHMFFARKFDENIDKEVIEYFVKTVSLNKQRMVHSQEA